MQDNASLLYTAHTTTAVFYTRYWEHVPVQPQVSPLWFSSMWNMAEKISWVSSFHLTPTDMRSRSRSESRLRKSHPLLLQVPEQAWRLCGQVKYWCPHTTICFNSTGLKKQRETQFLTSLTEWWVLVAI